MKHQLTTSSIVRTTFYILIVDLLVVVTILFGLHIDICQPDWIVEFYNYIDSLGFDVLVEIISLGVCFFVPHAETKAKEKFFLTDEEFEVVENKNRKPSYVNLFILVFIFLIADLVAFLLKLKFLGICIFFISVISLFYFLIPNFRIFLFGEKYTMKRIRRIYRYCVSDNYHSRHKLHRTKKTLDFYEHHKTIVYRTVNKFLIRYGYPYVLNFFVRKNGRKDYDRDHTVIFLIYIHCDYIQSLFFNETTFLDDSKMTLSDQFQRLYDNLRDMKQSMNDKVEYLYLNSPSSPNIKLGQAFSYLQGMILKHPDISSLIHYDLADFMNNQLEALDRSSSKCALTMKIRFFNEFFITSLKRNCDGIILIKDLIANNYFNSFSKRYSSFLSICLLNSIFKDDSSISKDYKDRIVVETGGDLINFINKGFIENFDSTFYATLLEFYQYNYQTLISNRWALFDDKRSTNVDLDYFFDKDNKLIFLWWFFVLLVACNNDEIKFSDVFHQLNNYYKGEVVKLIENKNKVIESYFDRFQKILKKFNSHANRPIHINPKTMYNKIYTHLDNYKSELDISKKAYENLNDLLDPIVKITDGCLELDEDVSFFRGIPMHTQNVLLSIHDIDDKVTCSFVDKKSEDVAMDTLNYLFKKDFPPRVKNEYQDYTYLDSINYTKNLVRSIVRIRPDYKSLGASNGPNVNKKSLPAPRKLQKLKDAPQYLKFKDVDLFYSKKAIKFNAWPYSNETFIRFPTSKEIDIEMGKYKNEQGIYEYNNKQYSSKEMRILISKNFCILTMSWQIWFKLDREHIKYLRSF